MKISRRDLRKIILESLDKNRRPNLLKEGVNLNKAFHAGETFRTNPNENNRAKVEDYKNQLEDAQNKKEGPFTPGKSRAQKAQTTLDYLNRILKASDPAKESAPPEPSEDLDADAVAAPEREALEDELNAAYAVAKWRKYGDEPGWEYKIQGDSPNEIWVTKKAGTDKIFKLNNSRYKTTVEKLDKDDSMPKRSPQSKANDPALRSATASSSSKRSSKSTDTGDQSANASVTSTSIDERAAIWLKNLEKEGKISVLAVPQEKLKSEDKGPDLTSVKTLDTARASLKKLEVTNNEGIINDLNHPETGDFGSKVDMYFDTDRKVLKIDGPRLINYELTGYSKKKIGEKIYIVANNYQYFVPTSQELGAAALGMPINENKVVYGESHATLIRKRYWGRY